MNRLCMLLLSHQRMEISPVLSSPLQDSVTRGSSPLLTCIALPDGPIPCQLDWTQPASTHG